MKNSKYVLFVLAGGAMYGTMSSFVKVFYTRGYSAAELSFAQAFLAAIILGSFLFLQPKNGNRKISYKGFLSLLLTGATIGLTNFLYYESVGYISASLAIIILMQFTWFSLMIEWAAFRKKPSILELLTVVFILIGTMLASCIFETDVFAASRKGIVLALLSSLTYATYIVANSRPGNSASCYRKAQLL